MTWQLLESIMSKKGSRSARRPKRTSATSSTVQAGRQNTYRDTTGTKATIAAVCLRCITERVYLLSGMIQSRISSTHAPVTYLILTQNAIGNCGMFPSGKMSHRLALYRLRLQSPLTTPFVLEGTGMSVPPGRCLAQEGI